MLQVVRAEADRRGKAIAVLLDLQGPKIRVGKLVTGQVELRPGAELTITTDDIVGDVRRVSTTYQGLPRDVKTGDQILLDDGYLSLAVTHVRDREVDTIVVTGGILKNNKGINLPGVEVSAPAVTDKDRIDIGFGLRHGVDYVAMSFVRRAEDVLEAKRLLTVDQVSIPVIAKIEKPQAVDCAEEIIRAADCVMVARGDLGIELPIEDVPIVQKQLLRVAGRLARPSITATQMLDSMVNSSRPTRAEVADVANAILDGTDAVMLSQETAVGQYPCEAVEMMASIAERTEHSLPYRTWNEERVRRDARDPAYTVAYSACAAARDLHLAALVVPTLSGRSARLISAHRPQVPIYALSPGKETVRRCSLMWGVQAASIRRHEITEALIADAARRVVELGWVRPGARIGITAGLPSGVPGTTSLVQIQRV
jgi:pyruvate kinase